MEEGRKKLQNYFIGKGEVKGFEFHQIKRGQNACLYMVTTKYGSFFEVFKIKLFKTPKIKELYEAYPKANAFGVWAWTYKSLKKAEVKFEKIEIR